LVVASDGVITSESHDDVEGTDVGTVDDDGDNVVVCSDTWVWFTDCSFDVASGVISCDCDDNVAGTDVDSVF